MTTVDERAYFRAHTEHSETHHRLELQNVVDTICEQWMVGLLTTDEYLTQLASISPL